MTNESRGKTPSSLRFTHSESLDPSSPIAGFDLQISDCLKSISLKDADGMVEVIIDPFGKPKRHIVFASPDALAELVDGGMI
jgi:hypothetical protein